MSEDVGQLKNIVVYFSSGFAQAQGFRTFMVVGATAYAGASWFIAKVKSTKSLGDVCLCILKTLLKSIFYYFPILLNLHFFPPSQLFASYWCIY